MSARKRSSRKRSSGGKPGRAKATRTRPRQKASRTKSKSSKARRRPRKIPKQSRRRKGVSLLPIHELFADQPWPTFADPLVLDPHYFWSAKDNCIRRNWAVSRTSGRKCCLMSCDNDCCRADTFSIEHLSRFAPSYVVAIACAHHSLHTHSGHVGPGMPCAVHAPEFRRRSACQRHLSAVGRLERALKDLDLLGDRALGAQLDWLAISKDYVEVAVAYGERSEEDRTRALARKESTDEPGWQGTLDLLDRFGIPRDYVPARRDAWTPGKRGIETRRRTMSRAHSRTFSETSVTRNEYEEAVQPARREYYAVTFAIRDALKAQGRSWPPEPGTPEAEQLSTATVAYDTAREAAMPLWDRVTAARKSYAELGTKGRTTLASGETFVIPRDALTQYWSALTTELAALFEHRLATRRRSGMRLRQGQTPLALTRWALIGVDPGHLGTTIAQMRFWLRS